MSQEQAKYQLEYLLKNYPQAPEWWKNSLYKINPAWLNQMMIPESIKENKKCAIKIDILAHIKSNKLYLENTELPLEKKCIIQCATMYNTDLYHRDNTKRITRNEYRKQKLTGCEEAMKEIYLENTGILPNEVRGSNNNIYSKIIRGTTEYYQLIVPEFDDTNLDHIISRIRQRKNPLPNDYYLDIPKSGYLTNSRSKEEIEHVIRANIDSFERHGRGVPCCDICGDCDCNDQDFLYRYRNILGIRCKFCMIDVQAEFDQPPGSIRIGNYKFCQIASMFRKHYEKYGADHKKNNLRESDRNRRLHDRGEEAMKELARLRGITKGILGFDIVKSYEIISRLSSYSNCIFLKIINNRSKIRQVTLVR